MIAVTIAQNAGINLWRVSKLTDYISITGKGSYELRFKSTDYSEFREIEETARAIMDRHTDTHDSNHVSIDKYHKKTYAQDFLEKFPTALRDKNGSLALHFCRDRFYQKKSDKNTPTSTSRG